MVILAGCTTPPSGTQEPEPEPEGSTQAPGSPAASPKVRLADTFQPPRACDDPAPADTREIPDCMRTAAESFLIHMLGEARAINWTTYDGTHTRFETGAECPGTPEDCRGPEFAPHYVFHYDLRVPVPDHPALQIMLHFHPNGTLAKGNGSTALPPCRTEPDECTFIPRAQAIATAEAANLTRRFGPWESRVLLSQCFETGEVVFLWRVSTPPRNLHGEYVEMDANRGLICQHIAWTIK